MSELQTTFNRLLSNRGLLNLCSYFSPYLLLTLLNFFVWSPSLSLDFYNDNYQIQSYLKEQTKGNPFNTFTIHDLSSGYYRPIPNFFHLLLLEFFDSKPLPFFAFQLLLYTAIILILYKILKELTKNIPLSLGLSMFFSLLPSHDIYLAWIGTNGDLLATFFTLLAFYSFYFKRGMLNLSFGLIFTFLAYLSKESTFVIPIFFFTMFIYQKRELLWKTVPIRKIYMITTAKLSKSPTPLLKKRSFLAIKKDKCRPEHNEKGEASEVSCYNRELSKWYFKIVIVTSLILLLLLAIRETYLNIHIFEAQNIQKIDLWTLLSNVPVSIVLSLFPTFALSGKFFWSLVIVLILFAAGFFLWRKTITTAPDFAAYKDLLILGLTWVCVFSLPLLPFLMRWYIILPSVGLSFILVYIIKSFRIENNEIIAIIFPIVLILIPVNLYSQNGWKIASQKAKEVLIASQKVVKTKPKALFWFVPQYYNHFFILRSGTQIAFNFYAKDKFSEILFPFPTRIHNGFQVRCSKYKENHFNFFLENLSSFVDDVGVDGIIKNDYYTAILSDSTKIKIVKIQFHKMKGEYQNFFYDGKKFIEFY